MNIYFSSLISNIDTKYIYFFFIKKKKKKKKKRRIEMIDRSSIQFLNIRIIVNFSHG